MSEELRPIDGHPHYWVSNLGNVYRKVWRNGHEEYRALNKDISTNGHARVTLNGEKCYVSKLVMRMFNPTDDYTLRVFHIGDKLDDSLTNLVWLTPSDVQRYSTYTPERRMELLSRA